MDRAVGEIGRCLCVATVFLSMAVTQVTAEDESSPAALLTIGSPAPPLSIEHWVFAEDGTAPVVQTFNAGQVYVVDFWATWCGRCSVIMPHLAILQKNYRDRGVQIISVSDEPLDVVEKFLKQEAKDYAGKPITLRTLTSAYSLATDPDLSTHQDYMQAAAQNGLPIAFIVGKSGIIEWMGHPAGMDEPLEQIVADSWDREAFAKQFKLTQQIDALMQQINQLVGHGKPQEALNLIGHALQNTDFGAPGRAQLESMRLRIALRSGLLDDQLKEAVLERLDAADDDVKLFKLTRMLAVDPSNHPAIQELRERARERWVELYTQREGDGAPEAIRVHIAMCNFNAAIEDWEQAIANLELALEAAPVSGHKAVVSVSELKRWKQRLLAKLGGPGNNSRPLRPQR